MIVLTQTNNLPHSTFEQSGQMFNQLMLKYPDCHKKNT